MAEKKEYRSAVRSRRLIHQAFQELLQGTLSCTPEQIMEQIADLIRNNQQIYRNWK